MGRALKWQYCHLLWQGSFIKYCSRFLVPIRERERGGKRSLLSPIYSATLVDVAISADFMSTRCQIKVNLPVVSWRKTGQQGGRRKLCVCVCLLLCYFSPSVIIKTLLEGILLTSCWLMSHSLLIQYIQLPFDKTDKRYLFYVSAKKSVLEYLHR